MNQKDIKEFVTLAAAGEPIAGYSEDERKRKKRFLALGVRILKDLGARLGANPKKVRSNPAGPAVSGDAGLWSDDWEICMTHHHPRDSYGDFFIRRGRDATNVWLKWEDLLDLDGLVGRLRRDPRLAGPAAAVQGDAS